MYNIKKSMWFTTAEYALLLFKENRWYICINNDMLSLCKILNTEIK